MNMHRFRASAYDIDFLRENGYTYRNERGESL